MALFFIHNSAEMLFLTLIQVIENQDSGFYLLFDRVLFVFLTGFFFLVCIGVFENSL